MDFGTFSEEAMDFSEEESDRFGLFVLIPFRASDGNPRLRFPSLTRKKSTFHRLLGKSPRGRAPSTTFSKDSSSAPSEKSSAPSEKIWGQLRHLLVHRVKST